MKKLFTFIILFISIISFGQTELELELRQIYWSTSAEEIINTPIPAEWNNESAVILKDHRYNKYYNKGRNIISNKARHEIIKIQDQSSLEYYSEIEMDKDFKLSVFWATFSRKENTIGIRVIKPDASVLVIDIENEEVTEDDITKIAIPNLQIGDILDIFIQTDNNDKELDGFNIFPAYETTLKSAYPVVDFRIAVEVEKDFFLNMNTYNAAPKVFEEDTDDKQTRRYVVEAQNLSKLETERWFYPLVEEPSIKYQIAFIRDSGDTEYAEIFVGEDGVRKSKVTKEDVYGYYDRKFNKVKISGSKDVISHIKNLELTDKADILKSALEYIRFYKFTSYFETAFAYNADMFGSYYVPKGKCHPYFFGIYETDKPVLYDLRAVCKAFDIDYDVVLVQPRHDGKLDDMLIKDNAKIGLKFNTQPNLYFFDFNESMNLERFPYELEGSEAYKGTVRKGKEIETLDKINLQTSSSEDNRYKEIINLILTDDKKGFQVNRERIALGHFEERYIFNWIHFKDFLKEDYAQFPERGHFYDCGSKKEKERLSTQYKALEDKKYDEFVKNREESVDNEWEEAEVSEFNSKVLETGRYGELSPLKVEENYLMKDGYLKKAGPNLIIEIGKFIGGQVELEDKERERKSNVYIDFAKTYNYEIRLEIPENYTLKGIDALNKSIENETGSFISKARVEDNMLIIETSKVYKTNFIENTKWSSMMAWLDEAYDFTQTKVLLEKK